MRELQYLYLAIEDRVSKLKRKRISDQKIEEELRLDIENCIDLIAKELSITLIKNS